MSSFEVIVYISSGCPYCEKVRTQLNDWGIEYEVRNVSLHKEYFNELRANKVFGTPATYVNGKLILGFQEKKFKKAFGFEEDEEKSEDPNANVNTVDEVYEKMSSDNLNKVYDLVIVGGGPAGASAAIYGARAKLSTLVIDRVQNAGTLAVLDKIANYPGVRESVTGLELLTRMQIQAKAFGAKFVQSNIITVDFTKETKEITVAEGNVKAKTVFIAVGTKAPTNRIKGEETFLGRGVSYCSTYDPAFYNDKLVVIVGDTDKVIDETATLSKFCREVRVLLPSTLHGEADLAILKEKRNVVIFMKHSIKEIKGTNSLEKIVVLNENHEELEWDVDGLILNVGSMKPETEFLENSVQRDEEGYIKVDDHLRTNVPGVFAGGDSRKTEIKQPVISAADGAMAALAADRYINRKPQS